MHLNVTVFNKKLHESPNTKSKEKTRQIKLEVGQREQVRAKEPLILQQERY